MADPISITAGIIAIAGLAYSSCRTLSNTIKGLHDAPNTLSDLRGDLDTVQSLLRSLQSAFEDLNENDLSAGQRKCFEDLEPYIRRCEATYCGFTKILARLTSHSDEDRVSWRDRGRLHLERQEITKLKAGLQRDTETLDIAINMATLRSTQQNQDALRSLERRITTFTSELAGELRGIDREIKTLQLTPPTSSATKADIEDAVALLERQIDMIQQSLRVCESGLKEASLRTGTTVENARVLDKAHQLIGNVGSGVRVDSRTPPVSVGYAEARDNAYQGVGNISDAALAAFLAK